MSPNLTYFDETPAAPVDPAAAATVAAALVHLHAARESLDAYRLALAPVTLTVGPRSAMDDLALFGQVTDSRDDDGRTGEPDDAMAAMILAGHRPAVCDVDAAWDGYTQEIAAALTAVGYLTPPCECCGEFSMDENACANCTHTDAHGNRVGECADCCGCNDDPDGWTTDDGTPCDPPPHVAAHYAERAAWDAEDAANEAAADVATAPARLVPMGPAAVVAP